LKKITRLKVKERSYGWNIHLDMYTKGSCPKVRNIAIFAVSYLHLV
jgi:hypothetical protein